MTRRVRSGPRPRGTPYVFNTRSIVLGHMAHAAERRDMGDGLRIHLFGEPHLEYGGAPFTFSAPPKTLPLLAFLLLHRQAAASRESIATALWPESDREESLANLRRHLHYLNKALPPPANGVPWITATARAVGWNREAPYWLDVDAFETQSQDRRYRAHAVRLYSGDLFERCADEWIFFERERLRALQMSNLAMLSADARARKSYLQALQYAQLMLALDPWREDALRLVIEVRQLLGDTSGAIAEYERFAERLRDELKVAPSAETAELYARLRRSKNGSAGTMERADDVEPIVGRVNELAILADEWHRARQGRCRLVLIGGEAGIGKTALLEALARIAVADEADVLRTAAAANSPYQPFEDILHSLRDAPYALRDLAYAQPRSSDDRLQFFDAFARVLERAAARPTLILIEDLHLAGAATLDMLRYLLVNLQDAPILFAASYRDNEIDRSHPLRAMRRQLARTHHLAHLAVTPLNRETAHELLRLRAHRPLSASLMDRIYEVTDGNPLFMIEALHQFSEGDPQSIPPSVAHIVRSRLESLNAVSRAVAESAAIAGRQCSVELITQMTGLREGEALRAVDDLIEKRIMREAPGALAVDFAFVHDIVRQAVYDQIPQAARRSRHARLGTALRAMELDSPVIIAMHFERGGLRAEAAGAYLDAARAAQQVYALEEAHYCASKVLDLTEDVAARAQAWFIIDSVAVARGPRSLRGEALKALEAIADVLPEDLHREYTFRRTEILALMNDERAPEALETLRVNAGDEPQARARYLLLMGEYRHQRGKHSEAAAELREAYELFQRAGDVQRALACFPAWLSAVISAGGLHRGVIDDVAPPGEVSDPRTAALLASARGSALYNYDSAKSYEIAEDMLRHAQLAEDRWLQAVAYRKLGLNAANLNRLSLAQSHLAKSLELMLAAGRPFHIAAIRMDQVWLAARAADFDACYEIAEDAMHAAREYGSIDLQVRTQEALFYADTGIGDFERALERVQSALEKAERHNLGGVIDGLSYELGLSLIASGDPRRGIESLERGRAVCAGFQMNSSHFPLAIGLAWLCAGDELRAGECADDVRERCDELRAQFQWPQTQLWAAAHLFHFLGRRDDAKRFAQAAYERYSEILAGIDAGRMRDTFLRYRLNRAIVATHECDVWAPDPLHAWFLTTWEPDAQLLDHVCARR